MTNAKAEAVPPGTQDDQSMEEILQSIRRIIAEEGDDAGTRPPPDHPDEDSEDENDTFHYSEKSENGKGSGIAKADSPPGSDVLELTDVIKEDGSVINISQASGKSEKPKAMTSPTGSDLLESIDEVIVSTPAAASTAKPASPMLSEDEERLVSEEKAAAAAATIKAFADSKAKPVPSSIASPSFRSGTTVEDLVLETLKPMLRDWLDTNLEKVVQRAVDREIKKIAALSD